MKRWMLIGAVILQAVLFAGCGLKAKPEKAVTEQTETGFEEKTEDADASLENLKDEEPEDEKPGDAANAADSMDVSGTTVYSWEEISVEIPNAWKDRYIVSENENGFSFSQKASDDVQKGAGYLFGFYRSDSFGYEDAGNTILAYTDHVMYSVTNPTDVPFILEDEEIAADYSDLASYEGQIVNSLKIAKDNVRYDAGEFYIPLSSTVSLTDTDLLNMNGDALWFARNEIYARHGKQFKNTVLQCYFDTCSWYQPKETNDDDLSQIEKDNITLLKASEDAYAKEHPYPEKVKCGKSVKKSICPDAGAVSVDYLVSGSEADGFEGEIFIDDMGFRLNDYDIYLENPDREAFYITDINEYMDGLEIAILDSGYNGLQTTHFFTCESDGKLLYLGAVPGCPFKDAACGTRDGFRDQGCVWGNARVDLLETSEVYQNWRYDYDKNALVSEYSGCMTMVCPSEHELYRDISVYDSRDESSSMTVIHAQKQVYFMASDGKEWILIKGKDGTSGYIHIKDMTITNAGQNQDALELFSNLYFSG